MNQEKILIIDNDEEILNIYSKVLSKAGYQVSTAATGLEGFNKVINERPKLVLLDMMLPDTNGLEILKKIKNDPELGDIYIIIISGSVTASEIQSKGLEAGADGYLVKPLQNKELVARTHAAFRHISSLLNLKISENELKQLNEKIEEQNKELKNINAYLKNSHTASLNLLSDLKTEIEERKQAQKAFVESERRFRELISTVQLLAVTLNLDGDITFCNDYLLDLTGWKNEEVIGKNWFKKFLPEEVIDEVVEIFNNSIHSKDFPLFYENEIITRNGDRRIIEWNNTILRDSNGKIIGSASIGSDITASKQAQNEIKKISAHYQSLIEKASDGVVIIDKDSNFIYISPAGKRMFGYSDSDDIKGNPVSLTHPEDLNTVLIEIGKLLQNPNYTPTIQYRFKNKNGDWIWIESTFTNLLQDPSVEGIVINFRDITERKVVEEELRISREEFKTYFDSSSVGLSVTAPDKSWIEVNQKLCDMMGYPKEELTNVTWEVLTHPDDIAENIKLFNKAIEKGLDTYSLDKRFIRKDGKIIYATISTAVQRNQDGSVHHLLTSYTDITDRKLSEEKLKENEKRYNESQAIGRVGNWEYNIQTTSFWGSEEAKRIYGFAIDSEDFTTDYVEECIPEREKVHQALIDLINEEKKYDIEFEIITRDEGKRKTIHSIASLDRDENGKPLKVTGILSDITERKIAENKIIDSQTKLRALAARLEKVKEEERINLSRELHDHLGQNLTGLKMEIAYFAKKIKTERFSNPDDLLEKSNSMLNLIDEMINNVRKISAELRPNVLDYLGLIPAIEWQIGELMKRTELKVELISETTKIDLGILKNSSIFRIVQEAFTNIIRHANATKVVVSIMEEKDSYRLEILDNGVGFTEKNISDIHSLGVTGMRERTLQFNGKLTLENAPQGGTLLSLIIPKAEN